MPDHAKIHKVAFGTGHEIFENIILPAVEQAEHEVILITCFLAPSKTKDALNESLLRLSSTALRRGGGGGGQAKKKIKVRIGFSSSGLFFQKLFHTTSPAGRRYRPSEWRSLGFLGEEDLGGLDVEIQSMFFLPFSVWHSKFVVVDRKRVVLPSCNVSWESWFEGVVEMGGAGIVGRFVRFWEEEWNRNRNRNGREEEEEEEEEEEGDVECEFLPSPHHRNPNFALFPWQSCPPPPDTKLNSKLLDLFANAKERVYIQTPNVTCPPVLDALLAALRRGVDVRIVTSERLMILEQLVTAGTTTDRCMKRLVRNYKQLAQRGPPDEEEEAGLVKLGKLHVSYYVPRENPTHGGSEPVQSHLKLTVVDGSAIVFGSGNMDRASWYTSQELGVVFYSEALITKTMQSLQSALLDRTKLVFDSENGSKT
ncbi:hypothetical protein AC579_7207 [Pseudocercospora musae]|uniref:PLD phosphodiesterase domain-containing protein n=1 Tax=Pseudocercospora musae TaxID=113226 RepID=A0A139GT56_9PEZI|nr:hypothetical protein AC579_7207 [Pseudocercospora musae]